MQLRPTDYGLKGDQSITKPGSRLLPGTLAAGLLALLPKLSTQGGLTRVGRTSITQRRLGIPPDVWGDSRHCWKMRRKNRLFALGLGGDRR